MNKLSQKNQNELEQFVPIHFVGDLEKLTKENEAFRKVIFTTETQQLVLMSIVPNEDIGKEIHSSTTQFIRLEEGEAIVTLGLDDYTLNLSAGKNDTVIIPPNTYHNVINKSDTKLKLYTIYSPPEHDPTTIQMSKPKNTNGLNDLYFKKKMDYTTLSGN